MKSPTRPVFDAPATGYEEIVPREPRVGGRCAPRRSSGGRRAASIPAGKSARRTVRRLDPGDDGRVVRSVAAPARECAATRRKQHGRQGAEPLRGRRGRGSALRRRRGRGENVWVSGVDEVSPGVGETVAKRSVRDAASAIEGSGDARRGHGRGRGGGPSRGAGQVEERGGEARGGEDNGKSNAAPTRGSDDEDEDESSHKLTSNALLARRDSTSDVSPCPCASAVCRGSLPFISVASISAPLSTSHRQVSDLPCAAAPHSSGVHFRSRF